MNTDSKASVPEDHFHLGITMAGAVTAGSYTGGVMDYLFEALELWERAKKGELEGVDPDLVPKHTVVIDAMGGASAGGMTTIMAAVHALKCEHNPVKDADPERMAVRRDNVFYDSWVLLDDVNAADPRPTVEKLWDLDDLEEGVPRSLLNSAFIDRIADRAVHAQGDLAEQVRRLPSYISKDLEVLISHTLLRGIPLQVPFFTHRHSRKGKIELGSREVPVHTSHEHFLVSHFKLNGGKPVDADRYLQLDPFDPRHADTLKLSAMATGAFPLGLQFREFSEGKLSNAYVEAVTRRMLFKQFGTAYPEPDKIVDFTKLPQPFASHTVDGGAVNNEPYAEVLSVLRCRYEPTYAGTEDVAIGVVMIDPFPDKPKPAGSYTKPKDILGITGGILGTLMNQSKVKRNEVIDQFTDDHYRGQVYPVKRDPGSSANPEQPIACGSVEAFGGLLDISFRHHDFFLGRNNARNFIRAYLSFPYDEDNVHPIHRGWNKAMVKRFIVYLNGKAYLPIIPDMNILLNGLERSGDERQVYDVPTWPAYDPRDLAKMIPAMETRMERLLILAAKRMGEKDNEATEERNRTNDSATPVADAWMRSLYRDNLWKRFKGWAGRLLVGIVFGVSKGTAAKRIVKVIVAWVLADLEKHKLLMKR